MLTALDAPLDRLDHSERNFVSKVREFGWFSTHVFPEDGQPGFSFSTGFWVNTGYPELILFGLKRETMHDILDAVHRDLKAGMRPPIGVANPDLCTLPTMLFPVDKAHYAEHLGWSSWFYGNDDFPCLQLVWSDRAGLFPGQPGFDDGFKADQPDLSEGGWPGSPGS